MASKPGILTEWPWQRLGSFKYVVLVPWVVDSVRAFLGAKKAGEDVDLVYLVIFPASLLRLLHNQLWISFSRFQNARSKNLIVHKGIDFDQVDRESNWDDQIILSGLLFYLGHQYMLPPSYGGGGGWSSVPLWRADGAVMTALLHAGPVEFLYYWFHRSLHHHYLYSRYHSHHHASIVTEPITSVIHPFAEHVVYFLLFAIPILTTRFTGTASIGVVVGYIFSIDLMNNMGHCNFEFVPSWIFRAFPFLKYLIYTPSFHSLHHTQFRTNYSLFMPFYDYLYGTMDQSTDGLYESSLRGQEETPNVVYLTHPTTLQSIYHLRLGFASLASKPYASKWYMFIMWPLSYLSMILTWTYGSTFTVERNSLKKLKMETWVIPRYSFQYGLTWEKEAINGLIEKAILDAEERGVQVVTLGLLNQGKELNRSGELYVQKHPKLRTRIVDGTSLTVAVVLESIPPDTKQVLLRGDPSKMACALALALCQKGIQVIVVHKDEYHVLRSQVPIDLENKLAHSRNYNSKVWIVGDGLMDEEQSMAAKGTYFIPFSQFPPRTLRKDCIYYSPPAMMIPKTMENMHSCENWLPRRAMSAWRVAGIVHALEGWDQHECGDTMFDTQKVWTAALHHGFLPVVCP